MYMEYKTLVMRCDVGKASKILPTIPKDQHNSVAHLLASWGMIEDALEIATESDYRFALAIQLGRLEIAQEIAIEIQSESKWKQLGELAMSSGKLGGNDVLAGSLAVCKATALAMNTPLCKYIAVLAGNFKKLNGVLPKLVLPIPAFTVYKLASQSS